MFHFKTMIAALCLLLIRTDASCNVISSWTTDVGSIPGCDTFCETTNQCINIYHGETCPQCTNQAFSYYCKTQSTGTESCCQTSNECNPAPTPVCEDITTWYNYGESDELMRKQKCGPTSGSSGYWYCASRYATDGCLPPAATTPPNNCPDCKSGYLYDSNKNQCCIPSNSVRRLLNSRKQ